MTMHMPPTVPPHEWKAAREELLVEEKELTHARDAAHLNARDTTIALVSRAPQPDIQRWKARMGWDVFPWYTLTDDFDADFDVAEWHGTNVFYRDDDDRIFRTYFVDGRGDEALGGTYPQGPANVWLRRHDEYDAPAGSEAAEAMAAQVERGRVAGKTKSASVRAMDLRASADLCSQRTTGKAEAHEHANT